MFSSHNNDPSLLVGCCLFRYSHTVQPCVGELLILSVCVRCNHVCGVCEHSSAHSFFNRCMGEYFQQDILSFRSSAFGELSYNNMSTLPRRKEEKKNINLLDLKVCLTKIWCEFPIQAPPFFGSCEIKSKTSENSPRYGNTEEVV